MIGAITAGVGTIGSIYGMIKSGKERKRQKRMIEKQAREQEQMFNSEYYKDFFDSDSASSALRTLKDRFTKDNTKADNTAVVTGATPEAVTASKGKNQEMFSKAVNQLAGYGTQYKDNVRNNYMNQKARTDSAMNNMQAQKAESWGNFASNAMNGISSGLNMMGEKNGGTPA